MRNHFIRVLLFSLLMLCIIAPAGLAEDTYVVTFYEENSEESAVLLTQTVKAGETAEEPETPQREGYEFLGWYGTPTYRFEFDFAMPIAADTAVFARWQQPFTPDERVWYLTGSPNGWNEKDEETYKMTRAEDANIFTVEADFREGDEFQINTGSTWDNQRGAGYMKEAIPPESMDSGFGLSDSAYKANMKVALDGHYEIVFNSDLDEITVTRLGDLEEAQEQAVTPTLVGTLNNYTLPETVEGSPFALTEEDGLYVLDINLNAGEQFAVTRYNDWSVQYRPPEGGNFTAPERARYRITLDADAETVNMEKTGEYEPEEGEPIITFVTDDGEETLTVRPGARVVRPQAPEKDGMVFVGWYDENGDVFPFNERTAQTDVTLTARFMGPEGEDTRAFHLYGTINSWDMADETYLFEKDPDANLYTLTVELKAGDQFQLLEGAHTENQVTAQRLAEGGFDPEKIGGTGNIDVLADGTYLITYDSFARALTIQDAE